MILKTLSRKSNTGQLFQYVFRYVFREKEEENTKTEKSLKTKNNFKILYNVRSRSLQGIINEYRENENHRIYHRNDNSKIFHVIISYSSLDKAHISDSLLKDVSKRFIEERGTNNLYAITKHEDKEHIHLHAIVSGTQLNGRSSRISKQKLHSIKLALDKYQREKYPQLIHSLPQHGKKQQRENIIKAVKNSRQTNKQALIESLDKIYAKSKSQEHFISGLQKAGHEPYFRNGHFQGVKIGEIKFRASRLGITKERLQDLDKAKVLQEKTLNELRYIRSSKDKVRNRPILKKVEDKRPNKTKDENEKLANQLSSLRSRDDEEKEINEIGGGDTADPTDSIAPASDTFESKDHEIEETIQTNDEENNDANEQSDDDNDTSDME